MSSHGPHGPHGPKEQPLSSRPPRLRLFSLLGVVLIAFGGVWASAVDAIQGRPAGSISMAAGEQQQEVPHQVWPDRRIGVTTMPLGGTRGSVSTEVLPFGAVRREDGTPVYARTYLHFPLDVFPPGTEIRRAVLYVQVDSSSGSGETEIGVYRVTAPWEGNPADWNADPDTWPSILSSAIAIQMARFDVVTPTTPLETLVPTATPLPEETPTPTVTPFPWLTETPPISPLQTPTGTPPPSSGSGPISMARTASTWLMWDITTLMWGWLAGEVPNEGLALASAPDPAIEAIQQAVEAPLLLARQFSAEDVNTLPFIIVEYEVLPVTPTLPPSPVDTPGLPSEPILPSAGRPSSREGLGLVMIAVGGLLLLLGRLPWRDNPPNPDNRQGNPQPDKQ